MTATKNIESFRKILSQTAITNIFEVMADQSQGPKSEQKALYNSLVFGHFRPYFGQKSDPTYPRANFFPKIIHQKKFSSKFLLSAKVLMAQPGGQSVTKIF